MALIAGVIGFFIGRPEERKKWKIIAVGMLVLSIVIAMIVGTKMFTDPIVRLFGGA